MASRKGDGVRVLQVRKGATLKEIYAAVRKQFTAADLAKYAEVEEGVPFEQIIADLEEIHRTETEKAKKKKSSKKA